MTDILHIDPRDHFATALVSLAQGDSVGGVAARTAIPAGHKIALFPWVLRDNAAWRAAVRSAYDALPR
ncbi:hypothetical protein [Phenylobacterium sp.]|uniref:hypothetical protein n=1 Tax=Phenylobacterium sp. TaxID=1871053 RepID=UPI00286B16A3|nr:hypothetical protein [Phenylobacterium sp.]